MERLTGFYKVYQPIRGWFIAEWRKDLLSWYITGREEEYSDYDFTEIDEEPILLCK